MKTREKNSDILEPFYSHLGGFTTNRSSWPLPNAEAAIFRTLISKELLQYAAVTKNVEVVNYLHEKQNVLARNMHVAQPYS